METTLQNLYPAGRQSPLPAWNPATPVPRLPAPPQSDGRMSTPRDNRQVVLLKSTRTNNRFYALVHPDTGLRNADAIEEFPNDIPLGIAYPCLEDGLNDFAVIRTTFETLDCFPDDEELRTELTSIINDARGNLVRRLHELRDRFESGQAHFLGTDLQEFKDHVIHMLTRGSIRRTLDSMMKVDVFESVAKAESKLFGQPPDPMFRYEPHPQYELSETHTLPPRAFIVALFNDVLQSVEMDANYAGKYVFDRSVFQKFIAVMFVNYATTDPTFYGTNREDYGVSSDKDMNETPLYQAVARALRELETGVAAPAQPTLPVEEDLSHIFEGEEELAGFAAGVRTIELPFGVERQFLDPLSRLAEGVRLLRHLEHARAPELAALTSAAVKELFRTLQELEILSPLASDPLDID